MSSQLLASLRGASTQSTHHTTALTGAVDDAECAALQGYEHMDLKTASPTAKPPRRRTANGVGGPRLMSMYRCWSVGAVHYCWQIHISRAAGTCCDVS